MPRARILFVSIWCFGPRLRAATSPVQPLSSFAMRATCSNPITGLFVASLNEVIDLHARRVTMGVRNRIPVTIWLALYLTAALGMAAVGYHAGLTGTSRTPAAPVLAVTFALMLWLVADLDRPQEGLLKESQQALIDLRQGLTP